MEAKPYHETFAMPADGSRSGRLLALFDAMSETAGRHAEKLGVGVRELHAKGLTWVLARFHVRAQAVPPAGETVHIATWPSGRHRLFAVRDFHLTTAGGSEVLKATSAWALMNMGTRRPARLDPHLPVFSLHPERMLADDFTSLPYPAPGGEPLSFRAAAADIDINDHVNNTVYLDWALRALPGRAIPPGPLAMEAAFLGEARLNDEILCRSQSAVDDGNTIVCQSLQNAAGNRELTRLRWTFRASAGSGDAPA